MSKTTKSLPARGPSHYCGWLFDPQLFKEHGHIVPSDDRNTLIISVRGGVQLKYTRVVGDGWMVRIKVVARDLRDNEVVMVSSTPDDGVVNFWNEAVSYHAEQQSKQRDASLQEVQRIVQAALAGNPEPDTV